MTTGPSHQAGSMTASTRLARLPAGACPDEGGSDVRTDDSLGIIGRRHLGRGNHLITVPDFDATRLASTRHDVLLNSGPDPIRRPMPATARTKQLNGTPRVRRHACEASERQ